MSNRYLYTRWHLAAISSQLGIEAAGERLSDHPGVGGQGLGINALVEDGGVLGSERLPVAGQGESWQATNRESLVLPSKAEEEMGLIGEKMAASVHNVHLSSARLIFL